METRIFTFFPCYNKTSVRLNVVSCTLLIMNMSMCHLSVQLRCTFDNKNAVWRNNQGIRTNISMEFLLFNYNWIKTPSHICYYLQVIFGFLSIHNTNALDVVHLSIYMWFGSSHVSISILYFSLSTISNTDNFQLVHLSILSWVHVIQVSTWYFLSWRQLSRFLHKQTQEACGNKTYWSLWTA